MIIKKQSIKMNEELIFELDRSDPLAGQRSQFSLPDGVIYLDGNSLGALPITTSARLKQVIEGEWGKELIRSWNTSGWYEMPRRIGAKIAHLIGAQAGEVIVADSTSVNLFKVLAAATQLRPERRLILSTSDNFPTDLYMAQGLIQLLGRGQELRLCNDTEVLDNINADTAVVMLTHVNYRTGRMLDMRAISAKAHEVGALIIWDLAHSAGALPVDLTGAKADFAVGCGYKYLNGGPGAPAFLFVAERHQANFSQPLSGWMGHNAPFAFDSNYTPAEGITRYLVGTQPVLSMTALECGVDTLLHVDMEQLRRKSLQLTDLFIRLIEEYCAGQGLTLVTPQEHDQRGSQVSFQHEHGYALMQALIARGVIGDFRAPDIVRFGVTPLYLRYADIWNAVQIMADILSTRDWDRPEFKQRAAVT
ncbi:MAG: kynureninase [Anaerolineae bacterium]|nr:kynureninase [Anaerolineae bacterium]